MVFSQGFHPKPKIQLASALPLGITSDAEVLDVWLNQNVEPIEFRERVTDVLPPGIEIREVVDVDLSEKSLQSRLRTVEYIVELTDLNLGSVIESKVNELLNRHSIVRSRRGKEYDLRPLIEALDVERNKYGKIELRMRLAARPGFTGRPEEVMAVLGMGALRMHRTALLFVDRDY